MEVVAAIIIRGNQILVQHHKKFDMITNPVGKVDPGETPKQAMWRELREEAGVTVALLRLYKKVRLTERDGQPIDETIYSYVIETMQEPVNAEPEKHSWQKFLTKAEIMKLDTRLSEALLTALELL